MQLSKKRASSDEYATILYPKGKAHAESRQKRLYSMHLLLLVFQLSMLIAVIIGTIMLHVLVVEKTEFIYYIAQLVVEVVLFSIAVSMVCNPGFCLGIVLITGHLTAVFFAIVVARDHTTDNQFECFNEKGCLLSTHFTVKYHLIYSAVIVVLVHAALTVVSTMVIWFFEGSVDYLETTSNLTAYLGARLAAHALPNYNRQLKSSIYLVQEKKVSQQEVTPIQQTSRQKTAPHPKTTNIQKVTTTTSSSAEPSYVGMAHTPQPESPLSYLKRKEAEAI